MRRPLVMLVLTGCLVNPELRDELLEEILCDDATEGTPWYPDADGDGYGYAPDAVMACKRPAGHVATAGDCNDTDAAVNPDALEVCDNIDNDCNLTTDVDAVDLEPLYRDEDGDGYGDDARSIMGCEEEREVGWSPTGGDCDDDDGAIHPDGTDVALQDRDCDGLNAGLSAADAKLHGLSGERVGLGLAAAGDLDGDGLGDFAVGAPVNVQPDSLGEVPVVLGGSRLSDGALNLEATAIWQAADVGWMLAGGGDVDGDGFDDLLVGAPGSATGQGAAYLVMGESTFGSAPSLSVTEFQGLGTEAFGSAGAIGDLDGDSLADMAFGAPDAGSGAGGVHLIAGAASFAALVTVDTIGSRLDGEAGSETGAALAVAGDLDGDGLVDLLVGAPGTGGDDAGAVHVLAGAATLPTGSLSAASTTLTGTAGSRAGTALAGPGDIDDDGYPDVLVGAPMAGSSAGAAYLLLGSATGIAAGSLSQADTTFVGSAGQHLGQSVAAAGDVDRDGIPDLILGAPMGGAGEAWVILGGQVLAAQVDATGAHLVIHGEQAGDQAGYLVTGVGDADGDGFDDLVISAPGHRYAGAVDSGAVYLLYGMPL